MFKHDLPFTLFTSFMSWFTLSKIDMGEVNHSTRFIENFVTPMYGVLLKRLQSLLEKPLPSTGKPTPFAILANKGTIKRVVTQPTLIRTVSVRKNNLFQKYYISHPEVTSHKGESITELLVSALENSLGWSVAKIRERFCGGSFDGQYIHLNVPEHMAKKLSLEKDFVKDAITWDIAHRVELACEDTKKQTSWLEELDTTLQSVMKKFTLGQHHTQLRDIAIESNETFLEFCLFSETRFMEYSHRTYDHFYRMYPILIVKIQRDVESGDIPFDLEKDREYTEKLLAQTTFIVSLLFMREMSHLMTRYSKSSQKFYVLPFHGMNLYKQIIEKLLKARDDLNCGRCPEVEILEPTSHHKSFQLWHDFKECTEKILAEETFHGFKLLLPSERGRVMGSGSICEPATYHALMKSCFVKFAKYIDILVFQLQYRFTPWP